MRNKTPKSYLRPPQSIEVSQEKTTLRFILFIFFIILGLVSLGIGLFSLLSHDKGWQTVELQSGHELLGNEIVLQYNIGQGGIAAGAEYKQVSAIYTDEANRAYKLFDARTPFSGVVNLYAISQAPNQTLTVEKTLYDALKLAYEKQERSLFLAPVYEQYGIVIQSDSDAWAEVSDPQKDASVLAYVNELLAFIGDRNHIDLAFLEGNQVRLYVSEAYLAYARENEMTAFLDFGWYKNAFLVDSIAQALLGGGHSLGIVSSYDGFTRNLDASSQGYSLNLYNRTGNDLKMPAVLSYKGPAALVSLRDYAMNQADLQRIYTYQDGTAVTLYVDTADALCRTAAHNLVALSKERSCAEIALSVAPIFIASDLDTAALHALSAQGITSVYFTGDTPHATDATVSIELIASKKD